MNGAPVARTASTCLSEISSIASVKSLPMKPIDATVSARMPASAPKPTALTNRIATIDRMERAREHDDERAPASSPTPASGCARRAARSAARARCRARTRAPRSAGFRRGPSPAAPSARSSAGTSGRRSAPRAPRPVLHALPRDVELRAGVDDVDGEQHERDLRRRGSLGNGSCGAAVAAVAGVERSMQPVLAAVDLLQDRVGRASTAGRRTRCGRRTCRGCDRRSAARARRRAC